MPPPVSSPMDELSTTTDDILTAPRKASPRASKDFATDIDYYNELRSKLIRRTAVFALQAFLVFLLSAAAIYAAFLYGTLEERKLWIICGYFIGMVLFAYWGFKGIQTDFKKFQAAKKFQGMLPLSYKQKEIDLETWVKFD
jgi:hypothetical protein